MWKAYTAVGRSYDLSTAVGRLASRAVGWDFHFETLTLTALDLAVRSGGAEDGRIGLYNSV